MAKGKNVANVITKDSGCPYCRGSRGHSVSQRGQCKKMGATSAGKSKK